MKTIYFGNKMERAAHLRPCLVDDEDYDNLNQYDWFPCGRNGYPAAYIAGVRTFMHHLLMPRISGFEIDHKDLNPFNNQKDNLRYATQSQNSQNKKQTNNTSGYKGVSFKKRSGKWQAQIMKDQVAYHLGYFITAEGAACAYDKKAKELFGEHALTNFAC